MSSDQEPERPDSAEKATEQVGRLRGVAWEWREGNAVGKSGSDMGVIAQELEEVFPELVTTGEDGYKRVNYAGLIGPLIEAIKELDERVRELERAAREQKADPE